LLERIIGVGGNPENRHGDFMPSSWTESNRLHSSTQRKQAAEDALNEYREEQALEAEIDDIIAEAYEGIEP
jgi:hypothetical protein